MEYKTVLGPWESFKVLPAARRATDNSFGVRSTHPSETARPIALLPAGEWPDDVMERTARLMAASPDLLEALEDSFGMLYLATEAIDKARRQQYDGVRPTDLHVVDIESCRAAYNKAHAAIAKATGTN